MVFLSPPNSNGLAVSTFQARTNPPLSLTRALAMALINLAWGHFFSHGITPVWPQPV